MIDIILGTTAAVGFTIVGLFLAWATCRPKVPLLKASRSDPDLTNILSDSLPTGGSRDSPA